MPFEVSKFYKTTCLSSGFNNQAVQEATFVPGDNFSEADDITPLPEEDEITLLGQEKNFIDEMCEGVVDEVDGESSEDDNTDSHESSDAPEQSKTQSGNKKTNYNIYQRSPTNEVSKYGQDVGLVEFCTILKCTLGSKKKTKNLVT